MFKSDGAHVFGTNWLCGVLEVVDLRAAVVRSGQINAVNNRMIK